MIEQWWDEQTPTTKQYLTTKYFSKLLNWDSLKLRQITTIYEAENWIKENNWRAANFKSRI